MPARHPHLISRATALRWRRWEYLLVFCIAAAVGYVLIFCTEPDLPPYYIDTAYPLADFHCPEGYDGPEQLTEHVVRCTRHTEEK